MCYIDSQSVVWNIAANRSTQLSLPSLSCHQSHQMTRELLHLLQISSHVAGVLYALK